MPNPNDGTTASLNLASANLVDVQSRPLQIARSLMRAGRRSEGLRQFVDALRQEPNNVRAYIELALAYAEVHDFDKLEATLNRLAQKGPRNAGVHHYIGEVLKLLQFNDRAIVSFERAARLPEAAPPTWYELALLYEQKDRLDEAEELILRIQRACIAHPAFGYLNGRILRRLGRSAEARAAFHRLISRSPADSEWACKAWSELAQICDAEGDFAGAIDAIEHCKRGQRPREAPHLQVARSSEARLRAMVDGLTKADLRRWGVASQAFPRRRLALMTGFPCSSPPDFELLLDRQPGLAVSDDRNYLGGELLASLSALRAEAPLLELLNAATSERIGVERERYVKFMEFVTGKPLDDKMLVDKNPPYALLIPLMLWLFPEARLLITLRDPRDVVLSCYLRHMPLNPVSVNFLTLERTAERYALDMSAWLKLREVIEAPYYEIRYEDAQANPGEVLPQALESIGSLEGGPAITGAALTMATAEDRTGATAVAPSPDYSRLAGRWKHYESLLQPANATLKPFLKAFRYE